MPKAQYPADILTCGGIFAVIVNSLILDHGAHTRARAEAGTRWDAWFREACATVDGLLGSGGSAADPEEAESSSRTVSDLSASRRAAIYQGPDARRYVQA